MLALSATFSLDTRMSAEHAWWPLVHGLIFLFCASALAGGTQRLLFEALFLVGAVTVLLAGAEFVDWAGRTFAAVDVSDFLRGSADFPPLPMLAKPLHASTALAGFVTPQVVVAFAWAVTTRRHNERIALAGLGIALCLVLLGTGSRGGFLSLAAAAIVFLLLRLGPGLRAALRGDGGSRQLLTGAAAVVLIAVTAIGVVLTVSQETGHNSGDATRMSLWNSAAAAANNYPILGVGTGEFGRAHRLYRAPEAPADFVHRQAHNIVLNTAAEEGIAGLIVLGWMAVALLWGWLRQRRTATSGRAVRLDAVLAALAAVAVQAQFDVFFTTPFVGLVALLAAYAVMPTELLPGLLRPRLRDKTAAWAALALIAAYGVFWIAADAAQADFERSVRDQDMAAAQQAAALDPGLHLYDLQIAYLTGEQTISDPALLPEAIALYEQALQTEPTWDTGWINLAGLYEQAARIPEAKAAFTRAEAINPLSVAAWNLGRIATAQGNAPDAFATVTQPASGSWVDRNFEGVLYGRSADFRLLPGLTPPSPGA